MKNHLGNLRPAEGSTKKTKRIGRGQGSGRGGTSTKGHKGAQSRSGYKRKIGFEGGQMPLHRRLPKFGFTNVNRTEYLPVNVSRLERLVETGKIADGIVTPEVLVSLGIVAKKRSLVKILGNGDITSKLTVTAHAFSESAKQKIEAAGGSTTLVTAS
ncbi:MAG: 50S ribosomal protein L15 [Ignavibacteria bacterium]|jgi:large subunit ribosomal protein L15|nr:50S ribosomal protein L15 [Ignavibacteria bacterium]